MERNELEKVVRDILAGPGVLGEIAYALPTGADLWEAGLDSMSCVNLMLEVEDQCEVEFPGDTVAQETFRSVDSLLAALAALLTPGRPAG